MSVLPAYLDDLVSAEPLRGRPARALILVAIERAAASGARCPTCDDLAELCGFESPSTTVWHINRLERDGVIRVWRFNRSRVVEIASTGHRTAPSREVLPHWRERDITGRGSLDSISTPDVGEAGR